MKIYRTQEEVEKDIKNGVLAIEGDVRFECSISIEASIHIDAGNITARNITALDIAALDITAWSITAGNITSGDIAALDITAGNINFYAVCFAYAGFVCKSIKGRRENSKYFSLDGEVEITGNDILKDNEKGI